MDGRARSFLVAVAVFGAPAAWAGTATAETRPPPEKSWCTAALARPTERMLGLSGPLAAVSERFREAHQRARAQECKALESRKLVVRYAFGSVEARWQGVELGPPVVLFTPYVHALKAPSHAIFLAELLFNEPPGKERDAHVAAALRDVEALRAELARPASEMAKLLPARDLTRQGQILRLTSGALRRFRDGGLDVRGRRAFFAAVRPMLDENLRRAAREVLTRLHETVMGYKRQVEARDPAAWASLVVVAAVAHQARAREIAVQYFERLLDETMAEGASRENRLVIVEGQLDAAEQRGALAAHDVDRADGTEIFGDPLRLQSDVLGDNARLLDTMLPPRAPIPATDQTATSQGR